MPPCQLLTIAINHLLMYSTHTWSSVPHQYTSLPVVARYFKHTPAVPLLQRSIQPAEAVPKTKTVHRLILPATKPNDSLARQTINLRHSHTETFKIFGVAIPPPSSTSPASHINGDDDDDDDAMTINKLRATAIPFSITYLSGARVVAAR